MSDEARVAPYTSRARVALAVARAIAAGRGDADVSALHIALGLLREGENGAVAALTHAGVPLQTLRRELEVALGPPPGQTRPEEVALPLTPGEEHVVAHARAASRLKGDEHIGPEHLLLGILQVEMSGAALLFARYGITEKTALLHVAAVVHTHRPPAESPPSPLPSN